MPAGIYPRKREPPENRFWSKVDKRGLDACWEWTGGKGGHGHGKFWDGEKLVFSHRFSYELHTGTKILPGLQINHHCDNRACVNPQHLYLGTQKDNVRDCVVRGRRGYGISIGENHGNSKLKDCEAQEVKRLAIDGRLSQWFIGEMFGISATTVGRIKNERAWSHL